MSASWLRLFGLMMVSSWLLAGCSSAKKIDVGGTCILNSDCNGSLVCTMGKCHDACHTTADCPTGQSCVTTTTRPVCQLPAEADCSKVACGSGFLCASDLQCHTGCLSASDCTSGQVCVSSVCADPSALVNGQLSQKGASTGLDAGSNAQGPDASGNDGGADLTVASVDGAADIRPSDVPPTAGDAPIETVATSVGTGWDSGSTIPTVDANLTGAVDASLVVDVTTGVDTAWDNGSTIPMIDANLVDTFDASPAVNASPVDTGIRSDVGTAGAMPTITSFVASAKKVNAMQNVTLTATFENGTGVVTPFYLPMTNGVGFPTPPISATTTFTLTVTNATGDSVAAQVTVVVTDVPLPTITSFVAGASAINAGHATTLTAIFANGTGVLTPGNVPMYNNVAVSTGTLNATTTYTLTVTDSDGDTAVQTLTVTVLPTPPIVASDTGGISALVTDGTNLYFIAGNSVMKVLSAGGAPVPLASGQTNPHALATDGSNVYWTDYSAGTVMKVDVSGNGTPVTLATGQYYANAIAVAAGSVYWTTYSYGTADGGTSNPIPGTGSVMKVAAAGGAQPVTLASGQDEPTSIAVFGTNVYWNGYSSDIRGSVSTVALAGGGSPRNLAVGLDLMTSIVVDATGIYWINAGLGISQLALSGGAPATLASNASLSNGNMFVVDSGNFYARNTSGYLTKMSLAGSGTQVTLAVGITGSTQIAVDSSSVYWTNTVQGTGIGPTTIQKLPK